MNMLSYLPFLVSALSGLLVLLVGNYIKNKEEAKEKKSEEVIKEIDDRARFTDQLMRDREKSQIEIREYIDRIHELEENIWREREEFIRYWKEREEFMEYRKEREEFMKYQKEKQEFMEYKKQHARESCKDSTDPQVLDLQLSSNGSEEAKVIQIESSNKKNMEVD
jgi:hypothetical protein